MPETPSAQEKAELDKALAEAAKAQSDADKAAKENAEWDSDLAKRQREAEARSAIAKADKETADSKLGQASALLPDLSKVSLGETTMTGDQPLFGSALAARALEAASHLVADKVRAVLRSAAVLVTTETELATSDAQYEEVTSGLVALAEAADAVLAAPPNGENLLGVTMGPAAVGGALATAVPAVLSLLSARRSIQTKSVSGDDAAAAMSVSGALVGTEPRGTVVHDDFRTLAAGELHTDLAAVRDRRRKLDALPSGGDDQQASRKASASALVTVIDAYLTSISVVPDGGKRSPLVTAMLREVLHGDNGIQYALLVKGRGGDAGQLINDRPLWFNDKFSTIASMSVSYLLVDTSTGGVVAGGTESATCAVHGKIGDDFRLDPPSG
ncbi:MAG: hypothetical protein ACOH17_04240 [Cellulomonas sp.]